MLKSDIFKDNKIKHSIAAALFALLAAIAVTFGPAPVYAGDESVAIDEINFPDGTFRTYVSTNFDSNNDNILSEDEIQQITEIDVSGQSVTSLTGIEHFFALEDLDCGVNAGITELDVSSNTALIHLICRMTSITKLDVGSNTLLEDLQCDNTQIADLDVTNNHALEQLSCYATNIASLDVTNNTALRLFTFSDTRIASIDLTRNTALEQLICDKTPIKTLDLSQNRALKQLQCADTQITSLNVSNNTALQRIYCKNTDISGLDVTKNTNLEILSCDNTKLAWLDIGTAVNLYYILLPNTVSIDLSLTDSSFNIEEIFPGITVSHMTITSGAELDGNMVKGEFGVPIVYEYDCGTSLSGQSQKLNVTLNLSPKAQDSTITIGDLDRTYNGEAVSLTEGTDYTITGSDGTITFTYYQQDTDGNWTALSTAPVEAGNYKVTITAAETDQFSGISGTKEFTIKKALNSWINDLSISGWTYGDTANAPDACARFGEVTYTYSGLENGIYTNEVPTTAGTWYVRASVPDTQNYTELQTVRAFTIAKAVPAYTIPEHLTSIQGQTLKDVPLPAGFSWEDAAQSVGNTGINTFSAVYTPTDMNNYLTVNNIILSIRVTKPENTTNGNLPSVSAPTSAPAPASASAPASDLAPVADSRHTSDRSPKTGDSSNTGVWLLILLLSASLSAFITYRACHWQPLRMHGGRKEAFHSYIMNETLE